MTPHSPDPLHPGIYIKDRILPAGLSVKAAAKLLGVGRPALSNLLNGKAALSPEMALRLEKAFGASQKELLEMQARFDKSQTRAQEQGLAVRAYVPAFLKITAREIEQWADGNLNARATLPVLLRKLIHSTGQGLSLVDFPGWDNAEKKGWDGRVDAAAATPWIPLGRSGWEFGCNADPKKKADGDYEARVTAIPAAERAEIDFVFVTPRKWNGKDKWVKEKQGLGDWKSVRAYDASDLEQWLEQSISAQGWLAEQMGSPDAGAHSLDQQWHAWASVTTPELPKELFTPSVETHKTKIKSWLDKEPTAPLIVCADSRMEALAFLCCLFESDGFTAAGYKDRAVVFSSPDRLRKLLSSSLAFIPIVFNQDTERELGGSHRKLHTIIVRPRNTVDATPDMIALDLLSYEAFRTALAAMKIDEHRADVLGRASGHSPTILRRLLSENPAVRTPQWAEQPETVRHLIPMMLVGAWHVQSKSDCDVLSILAGTPYPELEKQIATLRTFDDPPIWAVDQFRGVASKIDAFFAVHSVVTAKDQDDFLFAAEMVLSESDPALELPEDKRAFAAIYGKQREFSAALREGICETLVLLAVHGDTLFSERLGNVRWKVDHFVRRLFTPLAPERLLSQQHNLPFYAEAAPDEFLSLIEEDLRRPEPEINALMKPADSALFGGGCPRTGLLWALETLAWKPDYLLRVSLILAKLAERRITDNWANTPENTLKSLYRWWMPQTAASLAERKQVLETLSRRAPDAAWRICIDQLDPGSTIGHNNHRPRWRSDASGAGQPDTGPENYSFRHAALDIVRAWPDHNVATLSDLVGIVHVLPPDDQKKVCDIIDAWAASERDEAAKAAVREHIRRFAFTRRGKSRRLNGDMRDRARRAYSSLTPRDVVIRHQWLFAAHWLQESVDEVEDDRLDYNKREERVRNARVDALREIWTEKGFDGIRELTRASGASGTIGWHLADGVVAESSFPGFLTRCLAGDDPALAAKIDELLSGFLRKLPRDLRLSTLRALAGSPSGDQMARLLKASPFERDTWLLVDEQDPAVREAYWRDVYPGWLHSESPDLNEAVDRLLEAGRPRAAFNAVHMSFDNVETSRLKRLLEHAGARDGEPAGSYRLDPHYISEALSTLNGRSGVTRDEMARLEFLFIRGLDRTEYGIPNLERQLVESPRLFVQVLVLAFKRSDDREDPPEWRIQNEEQRRALALAAYTLLDRIRRTPGTDENGTIKDADLRTWVTETRALCLELGRAAIGDQKIGQVLSAAPAGADGIWPCEPVRDVLEDVASREIGIGIGVAVYNARGMHNVKDDAADERALAEKYRAWSRKLAFGHPYVATVLEEIAQGYDREAERWISDAAVRRRLRGW